MNRNIRNIASLIVLATTGAITTACPNPEEGGTEGASTTGASSTGTTAEPTPTTGGGGCIAPVLTDEEVDCSGDGKCPADHNCTPGFRKDTCVWNGNCPDTGSTGSTSENTPTTGDPTGTTGDLKGCAAFCDVCPEIGQQHGLCPDCSNYPCTDELEAYLGCIAQLGVCQPMSEEQLGECYDEVTAFFNCMDPPFECGDGSVIEPDFVCDYKQDCADGSDEVGCEPGFMCTDGSGTIDPDWQCDGEADCRDGSDEVGCPSDFECADGSETLPPNWQCDGEADCEDGSDELGCLPDFKCTDGSGTFDPNLQCNGSKDCADGSDELDCPENCGDSQCGVNEQCDDGNKIDGDGCQSNCTLTPGSTCGDGKKGFDEGCDDGNKLNGDGCELDCTLPTCGQIGVQPGEECDDNNSDPSDGCRNCVLTPKWCDGKGGGDALPYTPDSLISLPLPELTMSTYQHTAQLARRRALKDLDMHLPKFLERKLKKAAKHRK